MVHDLHTHGALAGNHLGIVVGMDQHPALGRRQRSCMGGGLFVTVAVQNDFGAEIANRLHLDGRRVAAHNDLGVDLQFTGGEGNALGVVARR